MLERSVGLDSTYAPSWRALGERYYYDSHYSTGGELMFQRSIAALERALTLDPNFSEATSQLVGNRVERGDLVAAYKDAKAPNRAGSEECHVPLRHELCSSIRWRAR